MTTREEVEMLEFVLLNGSESSGMWECRHRCNGQRHQSRQCTTVLRKTEGMFPSLRQSGVTGEEGTGLPEKSDGAVLGRNQG